jgi:hypothetical protein
VALVGVSCLGIYVANNRTKETIQVADKHGTKITKIAEDSKDGVLNEIGETRNQIVNDEHNWK